MTLKQQQFSPDTCTCSVIEQWDDALPADQVVYSLISIVHRGPEHAAIIDASLYTTIYEENRRKNLAQNFAVATAKLTPDRVAWAFNAARTLLISFPQNNVPANVKTQIQTWCDANLGIGLVLVS